MTTATAGYQGSSLAEIVNCDLIFTTTTTSLCSKYSKFSSKLPSVLFRTLEEDLDLLESVIKTQKKIVSSADSTHQFIISLLLIQYQYLVFSISYQFISYLFISYYKHLGSAQRCQKKIVSSADHPPMNPTDDHMMKGQLWGQVGIGIGTNFRTPFRAS